MHRPVGRHPRRRAVGGDDHRARAPRLRGFVLTPTRRQRASAVPVGARGPCLSDDRPRFAVLDAQWPAYDGDPCISWGDARLGNILWSGVEPVVVLDWEMVALAPPAVDLGWMLFFAEYFQRSAERQGRPGIPGFLARDASLERYERADGHRDLPARLVPALCRPPPGDRVDSHHGPRRALRRDARARGTRGSRLGPGVPRAAHRRRRRQLNRDPTCSSRPDSEDPWNT